MSLSDHLRRLLRREQERVPHVWVPQQLSVVPVDENRIPLPGTPPESLEALGWHRVSW
jgi:hypothetical protein